LTVTGAASSPVVSPSVFTWMLGVPRLIRTRVPVSPSLLTSRKISRASGRPARLLRSMRTVPDDSVPSRTVPVPRASPSPSVTLNAASRPLDRYAGTSDFPSASTTATSNASLTRCWAVVSKLSWVYSKNRTPGAAGSGMLRSRSIRNESPSRMTTSDPSTVTVPLPAAVPPLSTTFHWARPASSRGLTSMSSPLATDPVPVPGGGGTVGGAAGGEVGGTVGVPGVPPVPPARISRVFSALSRPPVALRPARPGSLSVPPRMASRTCCGVAAGAALQASAATPLT
jgi:hypothetical protein